MPIKLNTASGGGVILQGANTASDKTITIPADDGTMIYANSSGNVGIGTSSPVSKLAVSGGGVTIGGFQAGSGSTLELGFDGAQCVVQGFNRTGSAYLPVWIESNLTRFGINGNERARIDSSGNLLVNTTSVQGAGLISVSYNQSTQNGMGLFSQSTAASTAISFRNANGGVGSVVTTNTTTAYNTSSDYRLKENVQPMVGALAKVAALNPVTYTWKTDGSDGEGFIAHELAEVVPGCVTGEKDAVDSDGNPIYQGIDTSFLVATLTAAIQELKAEVDSLRAQVEAK